jgi:ABC-2 type transport system ATP-binding protein
MSELQHTAGHLVIVGRGKVIADTSVAELLAAASGDPGHRVSLEEAYLELTGDAVEFRPAPSGPTASPPDAATSPARASAEGAAR